MKNLASSFRAFTLVELLVVIALISILSVASVVIINPTSRIKSARDASRKSSLAQIVTALNSTYVQTTGYPASLSDLVPGELKSLPVSPSGQSFGYQALSVNGGPCSTAARDCKKEVVYDLYELPATSCPSGTTAYLAWTNTMLALGKVCSVGMPTPDSFPTPD